MSTIYLHAEGAGEAKPALVMDTQPKTVNGIPAHYFWRPVIADGEYVHPTAGFKLSVDSQRRRQWESNFRKMRAAGVEVPIVEDHEEKAEKTLGYVVDMKQDGGWLWELHQYLGEKARDTALKNRVSIGIDPDYRDGKGVAYGDAIRHSAITPVPVVPGQAVPIAASRGPAEALTLRMAAAGVPDMALSEAQLAAIRDICGAEVTAENGLDKLIEWAKGAKPKTADVETKTQALSAAQTKVTDLEKQLGEANAKIQTLSAAGSPKAPDPDALEDLADADETGLDACVERGAISKDVADKLKPVLLGTKGKRNVLTLARNGADKRLSRAIIDVLKDNKPGAMGDGFGIQHMDRNTPGDSGGGGGQKGENPLLRMASQMYGAKK